MSTPENDQEIREGQRIAKLMARAGLCSRRDAEQWIAAGRVSVNGEVLTSPAFNVSETDDVRVDGEPLKAAERTRLFLFHKPRGLVTTARDPEGRATIFDALPPDLPRVVAIGRLDINTEGLLLLTNDGGLSRILELPSTGWLRRYRIRAHGEINQEQLDSLRDGVTIEGVNYLGIEARFERQQGSNVWLTMGLREGKNREIKRVLEHMGLSVTRLIRVAFGPFELGDLEEGAIVEVRTRVLRDQLGPKLAKAAHADFDTPLEAPAPPPEPTSGDQPLRRRPVNGAPERAPRREAEAPRKRKHVSVLRAEARAEGAGPRKRIERTTTADRKGREVKIERVSLARRAPTSATESRGPSAYDRSDARGARRTRSPREQDWGAPQGRGREGDARDAPKPRFRRDAPGSAGAREARGPRTGRPPVGGGARPPREPGSAAPRGRWGERDGEGAQRPRSESRRSERDAPGSGGAREARGPRTGRPPAGRAGGGYRPQREQGASAPRDRESERARKPRSETGRGERGGPGIADARDARGPRAGRPPADRVGGGYRASREPDRAGPKFRSREGDAERPQKPRPESRRSERGPGNGGGARDARGPKPGRPPSGRGGGGFGPPRGGGPRGGKGPRAPRGG